MDRYAVALRQPDVLIVLDAKSSCAAVEAIIRWWGKAMYDGTRFKADYLGGALRIEIQVDKTALAAGEYDMGSMSDGDGEFAYRPNPPLAPANEFSA